MKLLKKLEEKVIQNNLNTKEMYEIESAFCWSDVYIDIRISKLPIKKAKELLIIQSLNTVII